MLRDKWAVHSVNDRREAAYLCQAFAGQGRVAFAVNGDDEFAPAAQQFVNPQAFQVATVRNVDVMARLVHEVVHLSKDVRPKIEAILSFCVTPFTVVSEVSTLGRVAH
jgi:hypothetical protein